MKNENTNSQLPIPSNVFSPVRSPESDGYAVLPASYNVSGNDEPAAPQGSPIGEYIRAIKARKWLVVAMAVLGCIGGVVVAVLKPVHYYAFTTLEIHGLNENFLNFSQVDTQAGSGVYSATSSNIQTQIRILESMSIRERVLERLKLETLPPPPAGNGLVRVLFGLNWSCTINVFWL